MAEYRWRTAAIGVGVESVVRHVEEGGVFNGDAVMWKRAERL